ncbi:MAG: Gfo/Idh/MocA family oxidoreductase [Chloroflexota bacterium]
MRFLICGLGSIGRRHLRNLRALGQEDIVLYRTGLSTIPDAELEGLPVAHDLETALERWRPDAALVTNPTALHLDVAVPAARAGCHLLIEKPVSDRLQGLEVLQNALTVGGGQLLVGFQFRFNPGLIRARELIADGAIGRTLSARAHWGEYLPDWHPWEDYSNSYAARADLGGGAALTLCHPFDYVRWLLGEVNTVRGATRQSEALGLDVEDLVEAVLELESGCLASVHLDYLQRPPQHWLAIQGSEGTLRWDGRSGDLKWWSAAEGTWHEEPAAEGYERNTMFLGEMKHFLAVARAEEQPRCTLEDGVRALEIALAIRQSAESGERVVVRSAERSAA